MSTHKAGPIEAMGTPDTICARVTSPGPAPRVHGFDAQADLARHYTLTECTFLALTGELPRDGIGHVLDVVAAFMGPRCVSEAPVHAGSLVQLCGAPPKAVMAASAIGLSEQVAASIEAHVPLLEWLKAGQGGSLPPIAIGSQADRESLVRMKTALGPVAIDVSILEETISREAAALALLVRCGLTSKPQLIAFLTWASLPFVAAEALSVRAGNFRDYPLLLPDFDYKEGAR